MLHSQNTDFNVYILLYTQFSLFLHHFILTLGEELLGNERTRYMKMDDRKDHDEDFLSPKKVIEYEAGLG